MEAEMFMVILVLDNPVLLDQVVDAWEAAGVGGITILPSTGMGRIKLKGAWRDDLPLIPSLDDLHEYTESYNRTLFTICYGEEMVDKIFEATMKVTGNLDAPDSGIIFALPVAKSQGIRRNTPAFD